MYFQYVVDSISFNLKSNKTIRLFYGDFDKNLLNS